MILPKYVFICLHICLFVYLFVCLGFTRTSTVFFIGHILAVDPPNQHSCIQQLQFFSKSYQLKTPFFLNQGERQLTIILYYKVQLSRESNASTEDLTNDLWITSPTLFVCNFYLKSIE